MSPSTPGISVRGADEDEDAGPLQVHGDPSAVKPCDTAANREAAPPRAGLPIGAVGQEHGRAFLGGGPAYLGNIATSGPGATSGTLPEFGTMIGGMMRGMMRLIISANGCRMTLTRIYSRISGATAMSMSTMQAKASLLLVPEPKRPEMLASACTCSIEMARCGSPSRAIVRACSVGCLQELLPRVACWLCIQVTTASPC